jgi:iron(III) transport system permease protein
MKQRSLLFHPSSFILHPFGTHAMRRWRLVTLLFLLPLAVPLLLPFGELLATPGAWEGLADMARLAGLARNTALLVAGAVGLALPAGTAAAILLYRTDLPGRRVLRALILLTLFVPLPLFTSGWQAVLGSGGWWALSLWNPARTSGPAFPSGVGAWTPWGQGVGSAVWIHAVAGFPWVVLIVGQGLLWVERELEEDALTAAPAWKVLLRVTLLRAWPALAVAGLWVALQTATEITVTDVMQVRTFAEEVYTQFVFGTSWARAVAVSLPGALLAAALVLFAVPRWERSLPPHARRVAPPVPYRLRGARWPTALLLSLAAFLLLGVPLGSLVWRAGLTGTPPAWSFTDSPTVVWFHVREAARTWGGAIVHSLLLAVTAGSLCAVLALITCWCARKGPWFRLAVLVLVALAWSLPGPVIGLSLKETIKLLLDLTESRFLARALYYGPSLAPVLWVDLVRFFPFALAVLWPVVRLLPEELFEAARIDGAGPLGELWYVVLPLGRGAALRAGLVVAILSLGEVSAGKLVETPGAATFAIELFTQMHYGVTNELAARCLVLLACVAVGSILLLLLRRRGEEG